MATTTTRRPAPSAAAASKAPTKAAPRAARKPAAQPLAKAAVKAPAPAKKKPVATQPAVAAAPAALPAPKKEKKPKLVRDSFTIPKNEYEAIDSLKARALSLGLGIKKSELLRAGLMQLAFMPDAAFAKALSAVPTLKTGRPAAEQASEKKAK